MIYTVAWLEDNSDIKKALRTVLYHLHIEAEVNVAEFPPSRQVVQSPLFRFLRPRPSVSLFFHPTLRPFRPILLPRLPHPVHPSLIRHSPGRWTATPRHPDVHWGTHAHDGTTHTDVEGMKAERQGQTEQCKSICLVYVKTISFSQYLTGVSYEY